MSEIQDGQIIVRNRRRYRVEVDPTDIFGPREIAIGAARDPSSHPLELGKPKQLTPADLLQYGMSESLSSRPRTKPVDHNPRTKKWLEKQGGIVEKCEITRVVHGGAIVKTDLLGIGDYIWLKPPQPIVLVQACAPGQVRAHLRKMRDLPATRPLLRCGGQIWIVSWLKPARFWVPSVLDVTEATMDEYEARKRK